MKKTSLYLLISVFIISSCGGGGGGGSSAPTPTTPAPSISFSTSSSSIANGAVVTLTWSSSNATSCTGSVTAGSSNFSGSKGTSGSEDVSVGYGTNTFSLSCTGAGGTSSQAVTVTGTQGYDATAFVGSGTKIYRGFLVHKTSGTAASFATVEFNLVASDSDPSILEFESARVYEVQYVAYFLDENENVLGLTVDGDRLSDEADVYALPITDNNLNGIYLNTSVSVDPFNFDPPSLDDLEQFSADFNLDFDFENESAWFPDLEIGVVAIPNDSPTDNTSQFMGYSEGIDSYTVLYLVEKGSWDENESNKPSESDILGTSFAKIDLFTAYQSLPNFVPFDYGMRVKSEKYDSTDFADNSYQTATLRGSFKADEITPSDNAVWDSDAYGVKYLFNTDSASDQRFFLKFDKNFLNNRPITNYEVYFLAPDKSGFVGFKLGGYDGDVEGDTNMSLLFNND
jgi:hypothetical protein